MSTICPLAHRSFTDRRTTCSLNSSVSCAESDRGRREQLLQREGLHGDAALSEARRANCATLFARLSAALLLRSVLHWLLFTFFWFFWLLWRLWFWFLWWFSGFPRFPEFPLWPCSSLLRRRCMHMFSESDLGRNQGGAVDYCTGGVTEIVR